jgi:hypothetical protein
MMSGRRLETSSIRPISHVDDIHIEDGEPPEKVGCVQNASVTEEAVSENPYISDDDRFPRNAVGIGRH